MDHSPPSPDVFDKSPRPLPHTKKTTVLISRRMAGPAVELKRNHLYFSRNKRWRSARECRFIRRHPFPFRERTTQSRTRRFRFRENADSGTAGTNSEPKAGRRCMNKSGTSRLSVKSSKCECIVLATATDDRFVNNKVFSVDSIKMLLYSCNVRKFNNYA